MTAHKMAHKMAHKNPHALRSGDGCATSVRGLADSILALQPPAPVGPRRGATEAADGD